LAPEYVPSLIYESAAGLSVNSAGSGGLTRTSRGLWSFASRLLNQHIPSESSALVAAIVNDTFLSDSWASPGEMPTALFLLKVHGHRAFP